MSNKDTIYRQDAIDALGNEPKLWEDPYSLSEDYSKGQREQWNDDREVLLNLPSAERKGKWIPCSERLPEKYGNYLVTTDDGEVDIGSCDPENKDRQDHFWSGCDADGFFWYGENIVIAWMPLPKSYMRGE